MISCGRALRNNLAAMHAGAGTEIDNVIGSEYRFLVVLHDDDRIADIAQVSQRAEQALVVALMQADGRLVEDVHDADQTLSQSGWPGEFAVLHRPTRFRHCGRATGSRGRRPTGSRRVR